MSKIGSRVSLLLALILSVAAIVPSWAQPKPKTPFTFILDFVPFAEYTPFYTALAKGWYAEEGLDVRILRGAGSGDTVKRIAAGQGNAGMGDLSALVSAQANDDIPVRAVLAYFRRPPHCWYVRGDSAIKTAKDLENHTLATTTGNSNRVLFPYFAQRAGIDPDKIKWVTMDGASLFPAMLLGRVDAVSSFAMHEPRLAKQAAERNLTIRRFSYAESGVDIYSLVLFARDDEIKNNGQALKAFLRATVRAMKYAWAKENIAEGAKALIEATPEINTVADLDVATATATISAQYGLTDEITSGKVAVGQFEPDRTELSRDIFTKYLSLKRTVPVNEIYTNDLIPEKK
jgi:NitT/TauT family transport system substrate-binding protein